mgnify:CR=1 FL=1
MLRPDLLRDMERSFELQADNLELLSQRAENPIERTALFNASLKAREAAHKLGQGAEELEIAEWPLFRHHVAPKEICA